jgi:hypothetical protein
VLDNGTNGDNESAVSNVSFRFGEMAEWLNVPDSKSGKDESSSWVQIPLSPPNKGCMP